MTQEKKHFLDEQDFGLLGLAKYRGCIIMKLSSGLYGIWHRKELTAFEIDRAIDLALDIVDKSIKQ